MLSLAGLPLAGPIHLPVLQCRRFHMPALKSFAWFILLGLLSSSAFAEEAVPQAALDLVPSIQGWGSNAVLIAAVKEQNSHGTSLDSIKQIDAEWQKTDGMNDLMKSLMSNGAAAELKKLEASRPFYLELFLMDKQGANVAMTNKTSDYWQGDEAKFQKSFIDGKGGVHLGEVKFDNSSQAYLVQISVPVMDGGKAIGALTVGINLDELEKSK
jgi:hypothetical protein